MNTETSPANDDPDGIVNEMAALGIVTRHSRRDEITDGCFCAYCVHYRPIAGENK